MAGKPAREELEQRIRELENKLRECERTEKTLRRDAERYRAAMNRAAEPLLIHDMEGRFTDVTPRACEVLGRDRAELSTMRVMDIDASDEPLESRRIRWRNMPGGLRAAMEGVMTRKDGSTFPVEIHESLLTFDGRSYVLFQFRDVARRKRLEDALASGEEQLKRFQRVARITNWVLNPKRDEFRPSEELSRIYGIPREPPYITPERPYPTLEHILRVVDEGWRGSYRRMFRKMIENGESHAVEHKITRITDGASRWIDCRAEPVCDENGVVIRVVGTVQDITKRKQAEEALRESERRYRDILEVSPAVITIHRREDERFLQVNPAFYKLTGYSREEVLGKTISELNIALDAFSRRVVADAFDKTGEIDGLETKLRIKDGSIIDILLSGRSMAYDGKDCILIAFTDITGVKRAEAELRKHRDHLEELVDDRTKDLKRSNQNLQKEIGERKKVEQALKNARDEAETANNAKSEFLANMSHEIRTPMNGVIGMTELLMGTRLSVQQKDYAEAISVSANALLKIINDVLDLSKIQAGKLTLESVSFNLRKVVDQIGWVMAGNARKKGLDILVWYPPDAPSRVVGDPTRVQQILTNLSSNAVKFTERGHVLIEVEPERKIENRRQFLIKVSDTGVGIPKIHQKVIFDKFSQADESMTRKFGGTGLGLAISKQLVEIMGGSIGVKSKPGKGSTFFFRLELPCKEEVPADQDIRRKLSGVPVLVVDDNKINRRIATRYLQSRDIPCHACPSGEDALETLRKAKLEGRPFRIAVLDYYMPEMTGGDLAEAIKEDESIRDTVLVLLSSGVLIKDLAGSVQVHFAASLLKPIRISVFLQTLLEAWDYHQTGASSRPMSKTPDLKAQNGIPTINASVLLVEDNAMNQRVAAGMLKRFGCRVDIAENGVAAVDLFKHKRYDILFMDAHMPMMDGFEATKFIRSLESGKRRTPIIAMTALAMEGDRDRCIEAGMDDYIPKPITSKAIQEILLKHPSTRKSAPEAEKSEPPGRPGSRPKRGVLLNPGQLLDISGHDEETIRELIAQFMKDAPEYMEDLEKAVRGGDARKVFKAAHRLKGLTANTGGEKLQEMILKIENRARRGALNPVNTGLESLAAELKRLKLALRQTDWRSLCK